MRIQLVIDITAVDGTDPKELAEQFFDFLCDSEEIDDAPTLADVRSFDGVEVAPDA